MSKRRASHSGGAVNAARLAADGRGMDASQMAVALNEQMLRVWEIYGKFFTVFLTVDATAFGLVAARTTVGPSRTVICVAFMVLNTLGFMSGWTMMKYTATATKRLERLGAGSLTSFEVLGFWGGFCSLAGFLIVSLLWGVLMKVPATLSM